MMLHDRVFQVLIAITVWYAAYVLASSPRPRVAGVARRVLVGLSILLTGSVFLWGVRALVP